MITKKILLENPERFQGEYIIPKSKLEAAAEKVLKKLEVYIKKYGDMPPQSVMKDCVFDETPPNEWCSGMYTGLFWLAYEMTGDKIFKDEAERHIRFHKERCDKKFHMQNHDVGFVFSPSCIAGYKVTGNEEYRDIALDAAEYFYNFSYSQKGGFVLRSAAKQDKAPACRTMMDTLMNVPLLFWAGKETGEKKYTEAAISQNNITEKYLIRDDASSYHHYQFEVGTHKPLHGVTFQGHRDESTWSRGHAWGIYGFPIAYSYTKDERFFDLHRDVTYFMLNHLPEDLIPYWDYDFVSGTEPRDSSASAISICGMKEMCRYLPDSAPQKKLFENAAAQMLEALIDKCTEEPFDGADGLLYKVSGAVPLNIVIEECAMYGDYPYFEALMRFLNPDWKMYW